MTSVINIPAARWGTYHVLLTEMQGELLRYDCSVLQKNFVDRLREGEIEKESSFNILSAASL